MKIFAYHRISDIDHDIEALNKEYSLLNAARNCWFACSQDLYNDEKYTIAFLGDLFNLEDLKSKYGHDPAVSEFGYLVKAIQDGTFRIDDHERRALSGFDVLFLVFKLESAELDEAKKN